MKGVRKNWNNLIADRCPCCSYGLEMVVEYHPTFSNVKATRWECQNPECGFRIGDGRKREIVASLKVEATHPVFLQREDSVDRNLAMLNNLQKGCKQDQ